MSGSTSSTSTGTATMQLSVPGTYTVQAATAFAAGLGVNVATVAGTVTGTQLTELGLIDVRTTVTTAAQESALASLAAGGIKFDLVLAPGQTIANFMGYADAINATTLTTAGSGTATASHSVIAVEGPDLTTAASVAAYTYTIIGNTTDTAAAAGGTAVGVAGGDYATVELFQAATARSATNPATGPYSTGNSATAIAGVVVLPYSTTSTLASSNAVGSYASALNLNLGSAPVGEPDKAALASANQSAATIAQGYNLAGSLTAVVSQAGASTAGGLLDLLLDTRASVAGTTSVSGTPTATTAAVTTTFLSSLAASAAGTSATGTNTGTTTSTTATAISLFDANGTLTAAGTALNNLEKILVTPTAPATTATAATTLSLTVGTYAAMTQVATNVAVFAATGGGDNIVWWDNVDSANGTVGHGAASLGFGQVESSVLVYDPTKGASAIGTYANISSLDVTDFGDGPLVVHISNVVGTTTSTGTTTASAVGTYAGVSATATSTVTGGSGGGTSTMTGGSGGGTTTMAGASGGVTTSMGASGATTLTSTASASNTITVSATGTNLVNSLGTDTVLAGAGTDIVYASGSSATVDGGAGTLIFIAGTGSYTAGGGTGNDILYGNSGPAMLTGGGTGNSVLVAGTGNTTLLGGAGPGAIMYGGTATNSFTGSTAGSDTLVGGSGSNTFTMTNNDVAFGGANGGDTYNTGTASALVVEGPGAERVNLGGGAATVFGGSGTDTYAFTKGLGGTAGVIGLKAGDSLDLTGGFTAADASAALSTATKGSFGTILHLSDGTTINVFGASVTASQISVT
jgi:collagen type VII alpha